MTRQEFLDELGIALQGGMSQNHINGHLRYYDNYITEEVKKGRSEAQVIEQLGSPRLIAKTLIDTSDAPEQGYADQSYSEEYRRGEQSPKGFQANYSREDGWDIRYKKFKINSWYGKLLMILIAVLIIVVIANVVAFLLPIVIPVVFILLILSLIFGSRR